MEVGGWYGFRELAVLASASNGASTFHNMWPTTSFVYLRHYLAGAAGVVGEARVS